MKVKVRDILRIYWQAARKYKAMLFFIIFSVSIVNVIELIPALYYKQFFDLLTTTGLKSEVVPELVRILILILILHATGWIFINAAKFTNNFFQPQVMIDLADQSFDYLLRHSHGFFAGSFSGALVERLRRLSRSFESFADRLYWDCLPIIIRFTMIIVILWQLNHTITFIIIAWSITYIVFNVFLSIWKLKYDAERATASSQVTATLADSITNHANIQIFSGLNFEINLFKRVTEKFRRLMTFTWSLRTIIDTVQNALIIIAEFFIFYFAVKYWKVDALTIGGFILVQTYFFQLMERLWDFGRVIRDIYESFADAEEMTLILETPHEIRDVRGAKPIVVSSGVIAFKHVSFSFHKTREVIKELNLIIKPEEKIALIGPSGAGKSTIVKLLFRFYDVDGGKIFIDDQNISKVTQESLRANLALVPQDPILFHRSLMENIRYGRREATDEEVIEASMLAHCHEFIDELPQKYETYVGERGIKLSGGERQRVAIARAILKNAPILVLDEATSSLDSESEMLIQDALARLMENKTTIVIAHRLSTIRKMDRIVVIDRGQVIEEGTHEKLIRRPKSLYNKLWKLQAGGFLHDHEDES